MRRAQIALVTLATALGCQDAAVEAPASLDGGSAAEDADLGPEDASATELDAAVDAGTADDLGLADGGSADLGVLDASSSDFGPIVLPEAALTETDLFSTSERCARCHSNAAGSTALRDASGRGIAPFDLWRSSMMANASRDPLFRAVMSAEIAATPNARAAIEAKCLSCHAPMAVRESAAMGATFALEDLYASSELSGLGLDGDSCAVCHQITPTGLGEDRSFTGGFVLSEQRQIYGPHANPFTNPMVNDSGFTPVQSDHVRSAALCGTCHTLYTDALDGEGAAVGARLPEQTPYLEWRNSTFSTEVASPSAQARSCQGCHMPTDDVDGLPIQTEIARTPGGGSFGPVSARQPFARHVLVGGNTLIPAILRDQAELNAPAPTEAFDATIAAARAQLEQRTARLEVLSVSSETRGTVVQLEITNLTGHKLPTAFPSRRVWLHVWVEGADGTRSFEVGGFDARGRLVDAAGALLASEDANGPISAHMDEVSSTTGPLVYESVMADPAGAATFTLLRGASYAKDNRLLPAGWRTDGPHAADTAPRGVEGDASFVGGGDRVSVVLPADTQGDLHAELLYQPVSPRWVAELARVDTAEVAVFLRFWSEAVVTPETLASTQSTLP